MSVTHHLTLEPQSVRTFSHRTLTRKSVGLLEGTGVSHTHVVWGANKLYCTERRNRVWYYSCISCVTCVVPLKTSTWWHVYRTYYTVCVCGGGGGGGGERLQPKAQYVPSPAKLLVKLSKAVACVWRCTLYTLYIC